jgi:hypothetical protein
LGDDTSPKELLTKGIQTVKDQQGNLTATVFDLDGPGLSGNELLIKALRYRGNFREYAELGDWKRDDPKAAAEQASDDFFWFSRSSCQFLPGIGMSFSALYRQAGDNSTGGATGARTNGVNCTPITRDLSGSCQ